MALHNELGHRGEDVACRYLEKEGYVIKDRNWRSGKKELDIIAFDKDELVIIEVKTRRNINFGNPEDSVVDSKIKRIVSSADAYIRLFQIDNSVRFDIMSVIGDSEPFIINHIKDAFYPPIWR